MLGHMTYSVWFLATLGRLRLRLEVDCHRLFCRYIDLFERCAITEMMEGRTSSIDQKEKQMRAQKQGSRATDSNAETVNQETIGLIWTQVASIQRN